MVVRLAQASILSLSKHTCGKEQQEKGGQEWQAQPFCKHLIDGVRRKGKKTKK